MPGMHQGPTEQQHPLGVLGGTQQAVASNGHWVIALGCGYIGTSAGLIAFNKYIIHPDRFPYAVCIVMFHMAFCSVFSVFLYLVKPSLFHSLTDPARRVVIDSELLLKGALPIAVLFSAQLVLSNTAYLHSSVAFIQMMKEGNLVLVYCLSLAVALERFEWRYAKLLVVVSIATALTIHGELHFSPRGFMIQGISQIFECGKIVLQAFILTSAGKKLDALTYIMIVMPMCFAMLSIMLGSLVYVSPSEHFQTPVWAEVVHWWPLLALNACVAFALNLVVALFVKSSSAVSFILAGIVKDAGIVVAGCFAFREVISLLQAFGFFVQLATIGVYTLSKALPDKFEAGIFQGLGAVLFGIQTQKVPITDRDYGAAAASDKRNP